MYPCIPVPPLEICNISCCKSAALRKMMVVCKALLLMKVSFEAGKKWSDLLESPLWKVTSKWKSYTVPYLFPTGNVCVLDCKFVVAKSVVQGPLSLSYYLKTKNVAKASWEKKRRMYFSQFAKLQANIFPGFLETAIVAQRHCCFYLWIISNSPAPPCETAHTVCI